MRRRVGTALLGAISPRGASGRLGVDGGRQRQLYMAVAVAAANHV